MCPGQFRIWRRLPIPTTSTHLVLFQFSGHGPGSLARPAPSDNFDFLLRSVFFWEVDILVGGLDDWMAGQVGGEGDLSDPETKVCLMGFCYVF